MRRMLFHVLFLSCVVAIATTLLAAPPKAARPNVIVILVDDFGWGDIGCYGNTLVKTPHLDQMAKEGTRFTQFYSASPICSPSRCGLITGQSPARWKITSFLQTRAGNQACEMADFLDPAAPTMPRMLQSAGYATAHIGKWHLGGGRDVDNAPKFVAYGYDRGFGTWESPEPHPDLTSTDWIWARSDKVPRHERTAWMIDRTLDFFKDNSGKPCFVNLWLDDTHTPFVPSAEQLNGIEGYAKRPEVKKYAAVLAELDRQIGRLLGELRTRKLDEQTLVILYGDNGALPTFDQVRVAGLRGSKLSLYEGGIRVPCLVWGPGKVAAGQVDETTVLSALDLTPSLSKLCQAPLPKDYASDGEELSTAIHGQPAKRQRPLFWEYGRNEKSFAYPKDAKQRSPTLAMREGDWKLLVNADGSGAELYDLAADRNEEQNLVNKEPARVQEMTKAVLGWRKSWPVEATK
jgi:arylsulfatase A-like enzyme